MAHCDVAHCVPCVLRWPPCQAASDFDWQKQCRVYWRPGDSDALGPGALTVSMCDINLKYCHEYLGCKERLVITPLTDRCVFCVALCCTHYRVCCAFPLCAGRTFRSRKR